MSRNNRYNKQMKPAVASKRYPPRILHTCRDLILCGSGVLALAQSPSLFAGPKGGQIIVGDGQIVNTSELSTLIRQNTDLMAIDWRSFDIDPNELVKFIQPGRESVALNRILDNKATTILGRLEANGQLFLVNSRGIVFGKDAVVNVGGLLATDLDIDPDDFASGNFHFSEVAGEQGMLVNRGIIQAAVGGSITLLGHVVRNEGELTAELGRVQLVSGSEALVTLDERGLIGLQIQREVYENLLADDTVLESAAVSNSGVISANGGQVLLKGEVTRDLFSQAVNNSGIIEATSLEMVDGEIVLSAGLGSISNSGELNVSGSQVAGSVLITADQISITGTVNASSKTGNGGDVIATAGSVLELKDGASIDVSSSAARGGKTWLLADERVSLFNGVAVSAAGARGGGEILIGGDYAGGGEGVAAINADMTVVDESVFLNADALLDGNGGKVVLWSDGVSYFGGNISAKGGAISGDGGFVETSGKETLYFRGDVNTFAENGALGELLLDPYFITISDTTGANDGAVGVSDGTVAYNDGFLSSWTISDEALESVAAGTNITLEAVYGITINSLSDDLVFDQTGSLTFHAGRSGSTGNTAYFTMDPTDTIQMTGGGDLRIYVENQNASTNTNVTVGNIISESGSVTIDTNLTDGQNYFGTLTMSVGDVTINNADPTNDFIFIRANHIAGYNAGDVNLTTGNLTVNGDSPITIEASPIAGQSIFSFSATAGNTTMNLGNVSVLGNADITIQSLPDSTSENSIGTTNLTMGDISVLGSGNILVKAGNFVDSATTVDAAQISAGNVSVGGNGNIELQTLLRSDDATRDANVLVGNVTVGGDGNVVLAARSLSTMGGFTHDTDDVLIRASDVVVQGTGDIWLLVGSNDGNSADTATIELLGANYSTSGIGAAAGQGQITFEDVSASGVVKNFILNPVADGLAISSTENGGSGAPITIDTDFVWTGNNKDLSFSSGTGAINVDWADLNAIDVLTLLFTGSLGLGSDTSGTVNFSNAALTNFSTGGVNAIDLAVTNGITAADVSVTSLPLILNADSDADGVGTFTLLDTAAATDFSIDSDLTIYAADIDLQGVITTGSSLSLVASDGQSIGIGAGGVGFDVSQAELDNMSVSNLDFSSTDNIQVNGNIVSNFSSLGFLADSNASGTGTFLVDGGVSFDTGDAVTTVNSAFVTINGSLLAGANSLTLSVSDDFAMGGGAQLGSAAGAININVNDDIALAANSVVTSSAGDITMIADADNDNNGSISMDQTAAITASAGQLTLNAYDDIVLGLLTSGFNGADAIIVDSTNGAVESADVAETVVNLTASGGAASVQIAAGSGIGSGNRINIDAPSLAFDNSNSGDVHIRSLLDLSLSTPAQAQNSALDGAVVLESAGNISLSTSMLTNGGDLSFLADNNIVLSATGSVQSNNGAVVFTADNDSSGAGSILVPTTATVDAGSGSITFNAFDDITVTGVSSTATGNAVTLSSSNGAIVNGGDNAAVDINAASSGAVVTLSAANGIGAGDALVIDADTLSASNSGNAAVEIVDPNALLISLISNASGGLINISSTNDLTLLASGSGVSTAAADDIRLTSTAGSVLIDNTIVSAGGNVLLDSAANIDLLTDAVAIQSGGGTISLIADDDIDLSAVVSLTSSGGDIIVTADDIADSNGFITMGSDAQIDAGAGMIALTASENILLTGLNSSATGNAINVVSSAGSITQAGDLRTDIVASGANARVTLNVFSGIGSYDPLTPVTDLLSVDAAIVDAQTASGDIALNSLSNVQVDGAVSTGGGNIYWQSAGDMLLASTGSGVNSAGGAVNLQAKNDSMLTIEQDVLSSGGNVFVAAEGDFVLQSAAQINSANGSIQLLADSDADNTALNTLHLADGTQVIAGSGTLGLSSDSDILLAHLQTSNSGAAAVQVISRNGAIIDNGDSDLDIDANSTGAITTLGAATGIGAGDALETAVYELDAGTNTGGVSITELDAVRIKNLRSISSGALSVVAGGALDVIATGSGVSAASTDTIFLTAGSESDLSIHQSLGAGGGSIDLRAEKDVLVNADVTTGNGNLAISADSNLDNNGLGGVITQLDGAQLQAGSGEVLLQSDGDITLANVSTSNTGAAALTISSRSGAIVDAGDTHVDIDANNTGAVVTLAAVNGVGASTGLETNIYELSISNANGTIAINETGSLRIIGISNSGIIDLQSATVIDVLASGSGISGASADAINLTVTGEADLNIDAQLSSAGGNLNLSAGRNISSSAMMLSNGGDITVAADSNLDNSASGGSISQLDGSQWLAGSGFVTVSADGDIGVAHIGSTSTGTAVTLTSRNGAIVDAGDSDIDLEATASGAELNLTAATGIGAGNALETSVDSIQLINSNGAIEIQELDALNIIAAQNTLAGIIDIAAGDALTVDGAGAGVQTAGADAVSLSSANEQAINLNQGVSSNGGNISLNAESDINLNAQLASAGGAISIVADSNADATGSGGRIIQSDSSQILAGLGTVLLQSDGDVQLANITTSNATATAVQIIAVNGSILDAGDSNLDIDANAAGSVTSLSAKNGIGAGNALEINVAALDSSNVNGASQFVESDGVVLIGLNNTSSGLIDLLSGGYTEIISSGAGVATQSADAISLTVTAEADLNANAAISSAGGSVSLAAEGDVQLSDQINSAGGNILVSADSNNDGAGAFTQLDGASIDAAAGTIQIAAAGDIALANLRSSNAGLNAISVVSRNGAIVDAGDSHDDVVLTDAAALLTLAAANGIGNGNALELNLGRVHVSNSNSGDVLLAASAALDDLQAVLAGSGDFAVVSQGDLVFGFGSAGIQHNGSGGISLAAQTGSIYINAPVLTQGGGITISADQNIELSASDSINSAGGDIQLLADANGDNNGSGGDVLLATGSVIDAGGGGLLLGADALVQTGVLSNIGSFESYATRTEVTGDLLAQTITQTGLLVLDGNLTSTVGAVSLGTVNTSDLQQIDSASSLLIDQLVLPVGGGAIQLGTGNDGDLQLNSFQVTATSDLTIVSEASLSLGDLDLMGGSLNLTVDSNNNEISNLNLGAITVPQLNLSGSAANDDLLLVSGAINSNAVVLNGWDSVSVAAIDSQSSISIDSRLINLSGDLLGGGTIDLLGAINLDSDVIMHSGEYADGGVIQLIGSVAGNQNDLSIDSGNESACACDADISDVGNLSIKAGDKLAVNSVQASGTVDLSADQEIYIKGAVSADVLAVNADADNNGEGVVFLGSDSSLAVNSNNLSYNVLRIDSGLIDCGPALTVLPELPSRFGVDDAIIQNSLESAVQETEQVESMAQDNQYTTKVEVSYIKLDCIAGDDTSSNSSCREKKSLHDFLGTFLINHQVPES